MSRKNIVIFGLIILLAAILRMVGLDHSPPHLSNDEISIAYDAYSVSQTGRDEHNHYLPLSFQSYNTYKAPLTAYLLVPGTILFGNNEYTVRLPSAILGTLTVLILGLLVWELTANINLSLLTSFTLAITPWHVHTSRMALESNIALFFLVSGIYTFYLGLHKFKPWLTVISFLLFTLSIYGYHTEWGFTPIVIGCLLVTNWKAAKNSKRFFFGLGAFFILITPIILDYFHNFGTYAR
ncbi:MAG: glycosyltransferase family 39 protein, partial [Patescibacteria group bacterium]|nr:glycosyltransferase family 39 protein [Patescibacteria group bacterium]